MQSTFKKDGLDSFGKVYLAEKSSDLKYGTNANFDLWKHEEGGRIEEQLIPTLSASGESQSGEFGKRKKKVKKKSYLDRIASGDYLDNPKMTDKQKIAWATRLPGAQLVRLSYGFYEISGGGRKKSGKGFKKMKFKRVYTTEKISSKLKPTHFFKKGCHPCELH